MSCNSIILEAHTLVILKGTFNWFLQQYFVPRLLMEIDFLWYITLHAYNRIWIDTLSSCILKPLKTIAVLLVKAGL